MYSFRQHSPFLEQSSAVVSEVEDYSDNEATQEAVEVSEEYISRLIIIIIYPYNYNFRFLVSFRIHEDNRIHEDDLACMDIMEPG